MPVALASQRFMRIIEHLKSLINYLGSNSDYHLIYRDYTHIIAGQFQPSGSDGKKSFAKCCSSLIKV